MILYADAARAVEIAVTKARPVGRSVRYGYFLRSLPQEVLDAVAATNEGNRLSASLTCLIALRVGALLDSRRRPVFEPENEVLAVAASRVCEDALIETVRRQGWLLRFDPAPDPFAAGVRHVELSDRGAAAEGDERAVLDNIVASCEVV